MDPALPRRHRSLSARCARLAPVAIPLGILLATGLAGLDFGRHWDEWLAMRALHTAIAREVLLPDFYNYPSVTFWLGFSALLPEILGDLPRYQGELANLQARLDGFVMSPEFRLRVRGVFLVVSSLAVLWTYLASLRWRGRVGEALLAATLLGLSFEFAYHARWIAPDAVTAQFGALCLLLLVGGARAARPRPWFLSAACAAGLATGTKYNAGLLLAAVLTGLVAAAVAARRNPGGSGPAGPRLASAIPLALGLFALTFLLTTPGALLQPFTFFRDVRFEALHYGQRGHYGFTVPAGLPHVWAQVRYLGGAALSPYEPLSWALFGLALVGAAAAWGESRRTALVLLVFPIVYVGYMGSMVVLFVRNLLPVLPFVALLGARGAGALGSRLPGPLGRHLALGLASMLIAGHGAWLAHAAGTIRDRGTGAGSGRSVRELDRWLASQGEVPIYVAPRVQAALDQYAPRPRPNLTQDPTAEVELAVVLPPQAIPELEGLPSNRPGSVLRTFGPREVNLEYYWTWPEPRIVVTRMAYAREVGLVRASP